MRKVMLFTIAVAAALSVSARPGFFGPRYGFGPGPRHFHHHHHTPVALGVGAGILGAGLVAATVYGATHPAPVVVQQPVATGHYETRVQNIWVEGRYVDQSYNGVIQRVWQPGHYEQQQTQVWVTP